MIKSGYIRIIDSRGRLTIPKRIRTLYNLDKVELLVENDLVCIRRYENESEKEKTGSNTSAHIRR